MSSLMGAYCIPLNPRIWYRLKSDMFFLKTSWIDLNQFCMLILWIYEMEQKGILSIYGILGKNDPNAEFINVFKGSLLFRRIKAFYGLIKALVNLQLQYFENKFPYEFMNARIDRFKKRFKWVTEEENRQLTSLNRTKIPNWNLKDLNLAESIHQIFSESYVSSKQLIQNLSEIQVNFLKRL